MICKVPSNTFNFYPQLTSFKFTPISFGTWTPFVSTEEGETSERINVARNFFLNFLRRFSTVSSSAVYLAARSNATQASFKKQKRRYPEKRCLLTLSLVSCWDRRNKLAFLEELEVNMEHTTSPHHRSNQRDS